MAHKKKKKVGLYPGGKEGSLQTSLPNFSNLSLGNAEVGEES